MVFNLPKLSGARKKFTCRLFHNVKSMKSILIFKSVWLSELSDSYVLWISRITAFLLMILRFAGDYLVTKESPGVMIKFLTGQNVQS